MQNTSEELKVSLAQLCMDGPTIHFFKAIADEDEHLTWASLKEALLERYVSIGEGSVFEQLSALRQEGSVDEYIQAFEKLVAQVARLPDEQYMGYFIHGLREGIRGRVHSMKALGPISRARLMNLARAVEIELQEKHTGWTSSRVAGSRGSSSGCSVFGYQGLSGHGSQNLGRAHNVQSNDWVYVKGTKDGPDKGGTNSGPKDEARNERKTTGPRDKGICHLSYQ